MAIVLVDLCCYNKIPQTGWFITTEIYCLQFWRLKVQGTEQSTLQGEKNIVGILWFSAPSFITPWRRSDSSAWRTRGETDCPWLTPFPLTQLWRIQEDFPEEVMAKPQRMKIKGK